LRAASAWRIRWTDFLVVSGLAACGLLGLRDTNGSPRGEAVVVCGGETAIRIPLDRDQPAVRVRGPLGETVVEVRDGAARVVESPCRDKVCVKMGVVRDPGDWAACLPNRVVVRVDAPAAIDAVTR
jgi:hypothetical protein